MKEAKKTEENGTTDKTEDKAEGDPDSYEARREARRKAREERLKAASAKSVPLRYSVVFIEGGAGEGGSTGPITAWQFAVMLKHLAIVLRC